MESFAYTHLALAAEEAASQELSNPEVLEFLTKLNLFILLKPQKHLNKALIYGLCMSLALVPGNGVFTVQLAESKEHTNNLASNPTSKAVLEQSLNSSIVANEKIQSSSISSPKEENQKKVLMVKKDEGKVNLTNLVNTADTIDQKMPFITKLIQYTESKPSLSKSNPDARTEPEQKGKLRFINDTPYTGIILFYKPDQQQPYTYFHVPPCKKRELYTTYSSWGKVSFNNHEVFSIGEASVKKGDFFEIKTSKLTNKDSETNSCQDASINQPVSNLPSIKPQEINALINTVKYLKKQLDEEGKTYNNKLQRIITIANAGNLLELFTNSLMQIRMNKNPSKTEYCKLKEKLKWLNDQYRKNTNTFKQDYDASTQEINEFKNFSQNSEVNSDDVGTFIILAELYLDASIALSKRFSSKPSASGSSKSGMVTDNANHNGISIPQPMNPEECLARLKEGQLFASAPNKKAKVC
ncbi:hypothetical protein [Planktothrix agardhii]|uniref:hypothetical protein n=1 Tax=Planktothrix agardhii TaxID=1160 RepID=UPI0020A8236C|nr:hypothetical protein [Planktothrix agardhii]CAD5911964.1 hypothetical protein NO758_00098 [Planktothrix agardhii]